MKKAGREVKVGEEQEAYQRGEDWDSDLVDRANKNARNAWMVAILIGVLFIADRVIRVLSGPELVQYPVVVQVDKSTGNMEVMEVPTQQMMADLPKLVDQNWVMQYVTARESYFYPLLQQDYDKVLALSSDDVGAEYSRVYAGPEALDKQLSDRYQIKIRIISVTLPPNEKGKAVVRFSKTLRAVKSASPESETTFVATLSYKYEPARKGTVNQLFANPLGFKVTAYRPDPELLQPAAKGEG